jgi:hypothetical protein
MRERVYYRCSTCPVCALALLIAVMTTPVLPSRTVSKSYQMICLIRNCSTPQAPPTPSTRPCFRSTSDGTMADAAEFGREVENEKEEECFVEVTGPVPLLIAPPLSTSLKRPAKQTKASGLMQSSPVLRC